MLKSRALSIAFYLGYLLVINVLFLRQLVPDPPSHQPTLQQQCYKSHSQAFCNDSANLIGFSFRYKHHCLREAQQWFFLYNSEIIINIALCVNILKHLKRTRPESTADYRNYRRILFQIHFCETYFVYTYFIFVILLGFFYVFR